MQHRRLTIFSLTSGLLAITLIFSTTRLAHGENALDNARFSSPIESKIISQNLSTDNQEQVVQSLNQVEINYQITKYYSDGYQVEINLVAQEDIENWKATLTLPANHRIVENYGILVSSGENKVNFAGDSWNSSLSKGKATKAILLIEGNPDEADLKFSNYLDSENIGEPTYSSLTEEERQRYIQSLNEVETPPSIGVTENGETDTPVVDETSTDPVQVNTGNSPGSGSFRYGEVVQKNWLLFMANRSGPVGADNLLEWRSDSTLNDGADVGKDLSGGYFDAGDHIKFVQPMAFGSTMLAWSGVDYRDAYQKAGQLDELLAAVKWSTDYFLKCNEADGSMTSRFYVQVGDANDHNFWVPPEKIDQVTARPSFAIDTNNTGSDAAAGAASALASASMLFIGVDDAYSAELLQNAVQLYTFAKTYQGKYSDSVPAVNPFYTSWSGYEDELVLAAIWLYRATGDAVYLSEAENYYREGVGHIGSWTYSADDHSYAAMALLAKESSDNFFKEEFKAWAQNWLSGSGGVQYTEGGLAVRAEWASAPLALGAAYLAEWYNDFVEPNSEYSEFAKQQLDYLLGKNPNNYSYVVGFGQNYPLRVHHRGSAGTVPMDNSDQENDNLLVGALVGGPRNTDQSHEDRRDDWVTNEVGTGYNAPLAASAIQQFDNFGGDPLPDSELSSTPGVK